MRGFSPPIRFLAATIGLWVAARAAMLIPWVGEDARPRGLPAMPRRQLALIGPAATELPPARRHREASDTQPARTASPTSTPSARPKLALASIGESEAGPRRDDGRGEVRRPSSQAIVELTGIAPAAAPVQPAATRRWAGDAYLFVRGDGGRVLAPGGQLGGGQAFARLNYRLTEGLSATVRASRALHARDGEVALGLAWQPLGGVRLLAERRIAVERGGRDAWSALAAGGIDAARVGPLRVDGYAQAGIVGLRSRDLFADGALRAGREIGRLTAGAGAWGAAQPGAARFDIGPQIALRLPAGKAGVTVALDGRFRVAGDARPGSGLALTVATGF